ncbi:MAG TPA: hypothetical protein PLT51_00805 [Candidatus Dojkabacteria bacterium]|nr:hypothetical protein [Candidatus Dojkabacteria bacterium]
MNKDEKITIINESQYESLLKMLMASEEDALLAFNILNQVDLSQNLLQTALLRKESGWEFSAWEMHCPTIVQYHNYHGIPSIPDFKHVYNLFVRAPDHMNKEGKIIYLRRYIKDVERLLRSIPLVEHIEINFKIKEDEQ